MPVSRLGPVDKLSTLLKCHPTSQAPTAFTTVAPFPETPYQASLRIASTSSAKDPSKVAFSPPKKPSGSGGNTLKGKEREREKDDGSGGVRVRWRDMMGGGDGGSMNPMRVIAHVDIDAAYAAMEMARLGLSPDIPLAVQQWNGLIAINYPARKFGIKRHETPAEALKKCPSLVMVHCATYRNGETEPKYWEGPDVKPETHKISLDHYRRESLKIVSVFKEFCGVVQKASIDESFLDLTLSVRAKILERYPFLSEMKDEAGDAFDWDDEVPPIPSSVVVDWEKLGGWTGPKKEKKEGEEEEEDNAAELEEEVEREADRILTWQDVALRIGAELVQEIRGEVSARLGYTCSAGISVNKMLAKLCSGYKKPNAQTILRPHQIDPFLRPLPFQKIRNLGGKLGNAIKETYAVETVADLQEKTLKDLQGSLGEESGLWVWEIVRGVDPSEVESKVDVKSMLSSKNFKPSLVKYGEATHWIGILATELHLRLVEARELSPGLWPKTLTFTHRSESYVVRAHQIPFPYTSSLSISYINKLALKLLKVALGEKEIKDETRVGPWGNLALSFSGLERAEEGQRGIEGWFKTGGASGNGEKVVSGNGELGVKRKAEVREEEVKEKKVRVSLFDDRLNKTSRSTSRSRSNTPTPRAPPSKPPPPPQSTPIASYTCPRCSKVLPIPSTSEADAKKVEEEHNDYHFARDMLEKERKGYHSISNGGGGGEVKTRVKVKDKGGGEKKEKAKGQQSLQGFFKKKS